MGISYLKRMSVCVASLASLFVLALSAVTIHADSAKAAPVTFNYEALITRLIVTGDTSALADIEVGIIPNTTVVNGTFSYEASQSGFVSGDFNIFRNGPNSIDLNVQGFSFLFNTPISTRMLVADSLSGTDRFGAQGLEQVTNFGVTDQTSISISLLDNTDSVFSQQSSLPLAFSLADFDTTSFRFFLRNFRNSFPVIGSITLEGRITALEVAAVPLPAALPLYGTGLALIGFIGWRRKRRIQRA